MKLHVRFIISNGNSCQISKECQEDNEFRFNSFIYYDHGSAEVDLKVEYCM